jgi:hypothetical protein
MKEDNTIKIKKDKEDNIIKKKKKKPKNKKTDENIIRIISNIVLNSSKKIGLTQEILGIIYTYSHYFYIFLISFIFSFNTNIIHLCILLIIITLDGFVVILLHGCPLTLLEKKYLNTSSCEKRCNDLKNLKIVYKCEHEYEKTIELLINIWMLVAAKCLITIFFNTFNFKLQNYNNIYA